MLESKEQKRYLITILVLILILGLVSFWRKPSFQYKDTTDYNKLAQQQEVESEAYEKYLSSLKVDPVASKELFQELLAEEDIRKEVEADLQVDQPINPPVVPDKEIAITNKSGQQAIVDYLTETAGPTVSFNRQTLDLHKALFSGDEASINAVSVAQKSLTDRLLDAQVPKEAVALHKSLISSLRSYQSLLETAKEYATDSSGKPWPDVYKTYAVVNENVKIYTQELDQLDKKYDLASLPPFRYVDGGSDKSPFVKNANAFLGIGDVTFIVGDLPSLILEAVREGLTASFSQFTASFIQKMVQKIESNYLIANFLYYSDALVTGQYVEDYLGKYTNDSLDRKIVRSFIPQFNCGQQPQDLKPVFQAKARQYLGFAANSVDPNDPEYFTKMARVGEFMASPEGWNLYYQDLASQAKSEAEKAAERELTSVGLKTPRDTVNNKISLSISGIVGAQRAALNGMFQLGISNAKQAVSKLVSNLTQTLMNNFVFRGASSSGSNVAVFKEQSTCLATAQMQLVLPATNTTYQDPPKPPTQDDIKLESEVRGCMDDWASANLLRKSSCISKINQLLSKCSGSGNVYQSYTCEEVRDFRTRNQ